MRRILITTLCLTFALAGCKAKELADANAISKDLEKRGTRDLMEEIAKDEYTAPEDGRITEATRSWSDLPPPVTLPPEGPSLSDILQQMRDEDPR